MPVRFILAPAGGGKTDYCLKQALLAEKADPLGQPLYLIVPQQATFIHEKLLCGMSAGGGFCRARVFSFNRLVYQAHKELGDPLPPVVSEPGKLLLASRVISENQNNLQIYAGSAASPGFASYLVKAAEELSAYSISPEGFAQAVDKMAAKGGHPRQIARLREISLLYNAYAAAGRAYAGYGADMSYLANAVRRGFLAGCDIYLDGYADFTPAETGVLSAMMADPSRTLNITLPVDPRLVKGAAAGMDKVFRIPLSCLDRLNLLAQKEGAEILPPVLLDGSRGRFRNNRELAALEGEMAGRPQPFRQPPRTVFLHQAKDMRSELQGVGRQIIRLTREEGLKYNQIGVITRDTAGYEQLLHEVFGELNIPYFIDAKKPLLSHALFELFRSALECWAYRPTYERMMRFAKNRLLPLDEGEADLLDEYARSHGLRFWHWLSEDPWDFPPMPNEAEGAAARAEAIRNKACGPLLTMLRALPKETSAVRLNQALRQMMQELAIEEALSRLTVLAQQEGRGEDAARHAQAWEKLQAFLDEAAVLLGDELFSADRLLKLYDSALSGLTVSTIPPGVDQVFVSSLERSRNPELAAAFVISLNDGILPRRVTQDGLFTDDDRRQLRLCGVSLAAETLERQFAEEYLAYVALTRSGSRLYLSYLLYDEQGRILKPSPLLRRVKNALPLLDTGSYDKLDPALLVGGSMDLAAMAAVIGKGEYPDFWRQVYTYYKERPQFARDIAGLEQGLGYHPWDKPLSPGLCRRLYGRTLRSSVSRLEKYRLCPFSWFASYGLKLRKRREYELDAASRGELYHQVLADIGRYVLEKGLKWQDINEKAAADLVDMSLNRYLPLALAGILKSSARYDYLAGRIRNTLIGAVLILAEHTRCSDFVPVAWELPFGNGERIPAYSIDLGDGRALELSGRIDRVDMAEDKETGKFWFRIIDYKSGDLTLDPVDIYAGLRLQLLVYLQIVLANACILTGCDSAEPAIGGIYYSRVSDSLEKGEDDDRMPDLKLTGITLRDEKAVLFADREVNGYSQLISMGMGNKGLYSRGGLEKEDFEFLQQHLPELLKETALHMLDGLIEVSPLREGDLDACACCDYAAVCGFDRELAQSRKKDTPPASFTRRQEKGGAE